MIDNTNFKCRCLKQQQYDLDGYRIVPLRHQDIQSIKDWRNAQMPVLRQNKELSVEDQEAYYQDIVSKSFQELKPSLILFSYLYEGDCIGYGGLVYINWQLKEAEVSFLVDTKRSLDEKIYHKDFSHFLKLIKQAAFQDLGFTKIYTETYEIRPLHISILETEGFLLEKTLKNHITKNGNVMDAVIHECRIFH